jgi:hypothetical protein
VLIIIQITPCWFAETKQQDFRNNLKPRLIMQTPLYVKHGESSSQKSFNPSLLPANKLDLLPEHHAQIALTFIKQLSFVSLEGNDVQILSAIYIQTIGFNKRKDDMNGVRLEQLTGIRPDRANVSVRRLERLNVIITSKGHHGKWMSVYFDFHK